MIRYGYSVLPYGDEPLAISFARVASHGYDTIELLADPENFDVREITELQRRYELSVASVCMIYGPDTDLVSADSSIRDHAREYVRDMIARGGAVGVQMLPITPTACMKIAPEASLDEEWKWASEAVHEAAELGQQHGVRIVIEPWNRYETYLINRLDQAVRMVEEVGHPNAGVKGDLFHMNIEERSLPDAIRSTGMRLWHLDVADSNRAAPGKGHIDFVEVMLALHGIRFDGILNMELLPAAGDPFLSIKGGQAEEFKDAYTELAIQTLHDAAAAISTEAQQ